MQCCGLVHRRRVRVSYVSFRLYASAANLYVQLLICQMVWYASGVYFDVYLRDQPEH